MTDSLFDPYRKSLQSCLSHFVFGSGRLCRFSAVPLELPADIPNEDTYMCGAIPIRAIPAMVPKMMSSHFHQ